MSYQNCDLHHVLSKCSVKIENFIMYKLVTNKCKAITVVLELAVLSMFERNWKGEWLLSIQFIIRIMFWLPAIIRIVSRITAIIQIMPQLPAIIRIMSWSTAAIIQIMPQLPAIIRIMSWLLMYILYCTYGLKLFHHSAKHVLLTPTEGNKTEGNLGLNLFFFTYFWLKKCLLVTFVCVLAVLR